MGTADLDFDSEINLVSVSPEASKAGTLPLPRERLGSQSPSLLSPGEGLRCHFYSEVNDKNVIFSAREIITVTHKVAYCNTINSGSNNSKNTIII